MISQIRPSRPFLTQTEMDSRSLHARRTSSPIAASIDRKRWRSSQLSRTNPSKLPKQLKITSDTLPV